MNEKIKPTIEGNKDKYKNVVPAPCAPPASANPAHIPVQSIPGIEDTNPIMPKIIGVFEVFVSVIIRVFKS